MRFESIIELPTAWSGVYRRFGVHLFHGRLPVSEMERLDVLGAEWRKRNPGKLVELVIIHPSEAQMTSEERTRMTKLIKRWEADRLASSTVILAEGLMGSLHRSVLTGLTMIAPPPHPAKVFGDVDAAVAWLAPYVGTLWQQKLAAAELAAAVEDYRTRFMNRGVGA